MTYVVLEHVIYKSINGAFYLLFAIVMFSVHTDNNLMPNVFQE